MKLEIENIGKIREAKVELNGITVVAGVNNSGKSTIGKVLYCVFNSFYKIEEQIYNERVNSIERILDIRLYRRRRFFGFESIDIIDKILRNSEEYIKNIDLLKKDLLESFKQDDYGFDKDFTMVENIDEISQKIIEVLKISDDRILETLLLKRMDSEFNRQINNIFFPKEEGRIKLIIKDNEVSMRIVDNSIIDLSNKFSLNTEVIYIDDPYVLDEIKLYPRLNRYETYFNHRNHLQLKLLNTNNNPIVNQIIITDKFNRIFEKINTVCSGDMIRNGNNNFGYKKDNSDEILDIKNTSTGLKTFIILKTLLQNGNLEENGTIILDEPEIHLHPEWQLALAELIVFIQKEFGMHILLNTHSPYFLRAIEVYSAKYGIADKCKYYLSENQEDKFIIKDVTTYTDKIYKKLAQPLENLQIERYQND